MGAAFNSLRCDGCGFPASGDHIARRLARLELATRFRPIRIHTLFVGLAPEPRMEDDFYRSPDSNLALKTLLHALDIHSLPGQDDQTAISSGTDSRLADFQRRGYYLTYLSECALDFLSDAVEPGRPACVDELITNLGPRLVKRIQLNYRPGRVVFLVKELDPLRKNLAAARADGLLVLADGEPLHLPAGNDPSGAARFGAVLRTAPTSTAATRAV